MNVEGLALITAVCTTSLHVRYGRGALDGYPPVVGELPRACEADLLEHGDRGETVGEDGRNTSWR